MKTTRVISTIGAVAFGLATLVGCGTTHVGASTQNAVEFPASDCAVIQPLIDDYGSMPVYEPNNYWSVADINDFTAALNSTTDQLSNLAPKGKIAKQLSVFSIFASGLTSDWVAGNLSADTSNTQGVESIITTLTNECEGASS